MSETNPPAPDLRCERVGLLLSLRLDGEATPDQVVEIESHVSECAPCRSAAAVDEAVRLRLAEQASVPSGFSAGVLEAARRMRAEARAQNRMLLAGAAAAVFVAIASVASFVPAAGNGTLNGDTTATARDRAVEALSVNLVQVRVEER